MSRLEGNACLARSVVQAPTDAPQLARVLARRTHAAIPLSRRTPMSTRTRTKMADIRMTTRRTRRFTTTTRLRTLMLRSPLISTTLLFLTSPWSLLWHTRLTSARAADTITHLLSQTSNLRLLLRPTQTSSRLAVPQSRARRLPLHTRARRTPLRRLLTRP